MYLKVYVYKYASIDIQRILFDLTWPMLPTRTESSLLAL